MKIYQVNSGEIFVGRTALREYSKNSRIENINYVTTKPYFFKSSIKANLKLINSNDQDIEEACKLVNVYDSIIKLKDGFDSPIDELTQRDKYLLSVARTLLIHSAIIVFYEFPSYLSNQDEDVVKNVIDIIRLNHTVVIFSATNKCDSIADKIYYVDDGKVSLIKDYSDTQKQTSVFDMLEDYENATMFNKANSKKKGLRALLKLYAQDTIGNKKK